MGAVVIDVSISLDGYMAAPNDTPGQGLGEDGMRLHNWMFDDPSIFDRIYGDLTKSTGAVIIGRRTYDNAIPEWGGSGPIGDVPCFVITHSPPPSAPPVFEFVTDGIESALAKAQAAAGDKVIGVMGGDVATQFLEAGLVTTFESISSTSCSATVGACSARSPRGLSSNRPASRKRTA
jgi:dihydrofolate reductase